MNPDALAMEIPGLEKLERIDGLEDRLSRLEAELAETKKLSATLLSGLLPGGQFHDRMAEVRAAVKEIISDPGQPHAAAARAALMLSWGNMSVEG